MFPPSLPMTPKVGRVKPTAEQLTFVSPIKALPPAMLLVLLGKAADERTAWPAHSVLETVRFLPMKFMWESHVKNSGGATIRCLSVAGEGGSGHSALRQRAATTRGWSHDELSERAGSR